MISIESQTKNKEIIKVDSHNFLYALADIMDEKVKKFGGSEGEYFNIQIKEKIYSYRIYDA